MHERNAKHNLPLVLLEALDCGLNMLWGVWLMRGFKKYVILMDSTQLHSPITQMYCRATVNWLSGVLPLTKCRWLGPLTLAWLLVLARTLL